MPSGLEVDHAALEGVLGRFLVLIAEPFGGKVLHRLYAPNAPISFKYVTRLAQELAADEFALGLAAAAMVHDEEHPGQPRKPVLANPRLVSATRDEAGFVVAWFTLMEGTSGRTLFVPVGFERVDDDWRIGWITLAPAIADWSYATGRLQTVSDYPFAEGAGLAAPRSWIDVAYHRLYDRPRPPLLMLADARFGCQANTACCTIGFRTEVSASAQAVIDAIPWQDVRPELVGTTLEPTQNGELLLKAADARCRFLDEQNHCLVHKAAGRAVFSVCAKYPFSFAHTPGGVAVSASIACPTVRANFGPLLSEREDDLYERLAMEPPPEMLAYKLLPDVDVSWQGFLALETALMETLGREPLPLLERLVLCSDVVDTHVCHQHLGASSSFDLPGVSPADLLDDFFRCAGFPPSSASTQASHVTAANFNQRELTLALRNLLFAKRFSYSYDLRTAHHANVFLCVMLWHAAARAPDGLPPRLLWTLMGRMSNGPLNSPTATGPTWSELLQRPGFDRWLLAYPASLQA
jgi:hypothetical protein